MSVDDLPEEQRLQWSSLTTNQRRQVDDCDVENEYLLHASDRLENPLVNPITGPGRTSTMVLREFVEYQTAERAHAKATNQPEAIFQSEYMLIRLPCGDDRLSLHRVCHDIFMLDAKKEDVTFTTMEYEHTPQHSTPACGVPSFLVSILTLTAATQNRAQSLCGTQTFCASK
eukprot:3625268-Pleurochrysis_carterae.AAC.1